MHRMNAPDYLVFWFTLDCYALVALLTGQW
ncbi:UNVERIFIED_CONTAM: hypothetical protein [Bacteriophage sp.]